MSESEKNKSAVTAQKENAPTETKKILVSVDEIEAFLSAVRDFTEILNAKTIPTVDKHELQAVLKIREALKALEEAGAPITPKQRQLANRYSKELEILETLKKLLVQLSVLESLITTKLEESGFSIPATRTKTKRVSQGFYKKIVKENPFFDQPRSKEEIKKFVEENLKDKIDERNTTSKVVWRIMQYLDKNEQGLYIRKPDL